MALLIFPDLSYNHIFFLLFFISFFLKSLMNQLIKDEENKTNRDRNIRSFFNIFIYTISDFFSIILLIIEKKRSKKKLTLTNEEKKIRESSKSNIKYIYDYNNRKYSKILLFFLRIFLISFTDLLAQFSILLFFLLNKSSQPYLDYLLIFNILFQYLFCKIFLKTRYYRHHVLSFIINGIGLLLLSIITHCNDKNFKLNGTYIIFASVMIFKTACYSFGNVIGKFSLTKDYLSPLSLLLYKGLIEIILLLIFSIPFYFLKLSNDDKILFKGFDFYFKNKNILFYYILLMIFNFLYNVFIWTITDKFSPSHLTMTYILEYIASQLFNIIYFLEVNLNTIDFIIYFLLIIGAAIHNEIIIINFCKLNEHTKMRYNEKALEDIIQAELISNDLNDSGNIEMIKTIGTSESEE